MSTCQNTLSCCRVIGCLDRTAEQVMNLPVILWAMEKDIWEGVTCIICLGWSSVWSSLLKKRSKRQNRRVIKQTLSKPLHNQEERKLIWTWPGLTTCCGVYAGGGGRVWAESWVVGSEFWGGSEVSRTGHRGKGELVFSRSARRASGREREDSVAPQKPHFTSQTFMVVPDVAKFIYQVLKVNQEIQVKKVNLKSMQSIRLHDKKVWSWVKERRVNDRRDETHTNACTGSYVPNTTIRGLRG